MNNVLRKMNNEIDYKMKSSLYLSENFVKGLNLKEVRKTIGGKNNKETIVKALELYAFNNVDINKSFVEQFKYDSSKTAIFNEIYHKNNSEKIDETKKITSKNIIKLEFWKIAICINSYNYASTLEEYIEGIIKWSNSFCVKLSGEDI